MQIQVGKPAPEIKTSEFSLAGFKGQGLTFRDWDGQMREPILIVGSRLLVSISPQPAFLHQQDRMPCGTAQFDQRPQRARRGRDREASPIR